jgi:hypothetical protein
MQLPEAPRIRIPTEVELTNEERRSAMGTTHLLPWLFGCGTWLLLTIVLFTVLAGAGGRGAEGIGCLLAQILPFIAACVVVAVSYKTLTPGALDRAVHTKHARLAQAAQEAERKIEEIRSNSLRIVKELSTELSASLASLAQAREEFSSNAFGPFWDTVEKGALHLARFKVSVDMLSENARKDEEILSHWKHSFPPFPVTRDLIPDATPAVHELQQVVRLGQTNFEFASIWEQRKTREVLIEGFDTLGQAIVELGSAITGSVSKLESRMASELAESRAVQEEVRKAIGTHGQTQERLLEEQRDSLKRIEEKNRGL